MRRRITDGQGMVPTDILRLSGADLQPAVGLAIHVNRPRHQGDTPLHDHDFLEAALVLGGRGVHRTVHGSQPVRPGDAVILHPGQWHAWERCRNLDLMNLVIGPAVLGRELAWVVRDPDLGRLLPPARHHRHPGQGVLALHLTGTALAACAADLERIRSLQGPDGAIPRQGRSEAVARSLLVLGRLTAGLSGPAAADAGADPVLLPDGLLPEDLRRCLDAMEERLAHPWALDELERIAGIGRFALARRFRRHLGMAPMAWLIRRRAEVAAVLLLTTSASVAHIGRRVGWSDPSYLARRFRAVFGQGPADYRAGLPMPAATRQVEDWVQW